MFFSSVWCVTPLSLLSRMCIPFSIPVPVGPHFLESVFFFFAESAEFRGTHIGIKSFQGKINLFQNPTESGIPAGILEGRKELWPLSATILYNTTILLQFAAITVVSTGSRHKPPATSPARRCWNRTFRKDQEHRIQGAHVYTNTTICY